MVDGVKVDFLLTTLPKPPSVEFMSSLLFGMNWGSWCRVIRFFGCLRREGYLRERVDPSSVGVDVAGVNSVGIVGTLNMKSPSLSDPLDSMLDSKSAGMQTFGRSALRNVEIVSCSEEDIF